MRVPFCKCTHTFEPALVFTECLDEFSEVFLRILLRVAFWGIKYSRWEDESINPPHPCFCAVEVVAQRQELSLVQLAQVQPRVLHLWSKRKKRWGCGWHHRLGRCIAPSATREL